ncbi:hypothetical protein Tco_0865168 [Tanacetum coccineum]
MLAKQNDPISKENKFNSTPINYVELNQLSEDFGKRFVPQQELYAEQDFWLQTSHPNTDQSDISPVKIEAPRELPKHSVAKLLSENELLHKEIEHLNVGCQKPGHLAARLGCAETKVVTWDDLAFKLINIRKWIFKKRNKKKDKNNKSKHRVERAKSKVKPIEETTT